MTNLPRYEVITLLDIGLSDEADELDIGSAIKDFLEDTYGVICSNFDWEWCGNDLVVTNIRWNLSTKE